MPSKTWNRCYDSGLSEATTQLVIALQECFRNGKGWCLYLDSEADRQRTGMLLCILSETSPTVAAFPPGLIHDQRKCDPRTL